MGAVRFKAVLPNGTVLTGPIMGNGGMLGAGIGDVKLAKRIALDRVKYAQRMVGQHHRGGIYEPEPGCVAIYPDFSADGDGEPVAVPLLGTDFSIAEGEKL